jgi:hypothetical protein
MSRELAPIYIEIENYEKSIKIDKLVLRKITDKEREKIFGIKDVKKENNSYSFNQTKSDFLVKDDFTSNHIKFTNFILESDEDNYLAKNLRSLLLAFNLYTEGRVDAPYQIAKNGVLYDMQTRSYKGNKLVIDSNEIKEVEDIFKLILKNKYEKLTLLLERFRGTYFANLRDENIFIELMSIIESLLDIGNSELSYRLSLYTSYLLKNKCNYEISFKRVKDLYNIRSKLIHQGVLKEGLNKSDLITLRRSVSNLLLLALKEMKQIKNVEIDIKKKLDVN